MRFDDVFMITLSLKEYIITNNIREKSKNCTPLKCYTLNDAIFEDIFLIFWKNPFYQSLFVMLQIYSKVWCILIFCVGPH